jgi:hypothetical protein
MSEFLTCLCRISRPVGFRSLFLAAVFFTAAGNSASAQLVYVVQNTADSGAGSLRQLLFSANGFPLENGEMIIDFSVIQAAALPGQAVIEIYPPFSLDIERRMSWVASPDMPKPVIRVGSGRMRHIQVNSNVSGLLEFVNLRFENGYPSGSSAGGSIIYTQNSDAPSVQMRIIGCEFVGNTIGDETPANRPFTASGGAISFIANSMAPEASTLVVENSRFEGNRALAISQPEGAAIRAENAGVTIRDSVFLNHICEGAEGLQGGALFITGQRSSAVIERCWFGGNESTGASALVLRHFAVPVDAPPDELRDNSFIGNSGYGGAVLFRGTATPRMPVRLRNCTFAANTGHLGTAITAESAAVEMHHCTVSDNTHHDRNGAAVHMPFTSSSTLTISRSVVAGNRHQGNDQNTLYSPDIVRMIGTVTSQGYNFIGSNNGLSGVFNGPDDLVGTNTNPLVPMLAMPGNYGGPVPTMPPLPESPLVDGMPQAASTFVLLDARGLTRPAGVRGDIGAVELPRVPYSDWQLQIPVAGNRGSGLDPDGDGLTNLLEYLFDTNPNAATPSPVRMVRTDDGWFVEVRRSSRIRPAFFSQIRLDASDNLIHWDPAGISPLVTPYEEGSIDLMRYRYPVDPLADGVRFFRMTAQ